MSSGVLFVCRANICRSPMAEALLRAKLPAGGAVTVTSAGLEPLVGHGMDLAAAHAVRERGADPSGHRARAVTAQAVADSDLILAATVEQRDELARRFPTATARLFTVRQFARTRTGGPVTGPDDIGDPFGAPAWLMAACADLLDTATTAIARVLA